MSVEVVRVRFPKVLADDSYTYGQCGYCSVDCPVYNVMRWESYSPRGKIFLFKKLLSLLRGYMHVQHVVDVQLYVVNVHTSVI